MDEALMLYDEDVCWGRESD